MLYAFSSDASGSMRFLGQGESYTTVDEQDVTIGIEKALRALKISLRIDSLTGMHSSHLRVRPVDSE